MTITTGTETADEGYLEVDVNGNSAVSWDLFNQGDVVLNECFETLSPGITLSNWNSNAWVGYVEVSVLGVSEALVCPSCAGDPFSGKIVVEGSNNNFNAAPTQCPGGNECTILPGINCGLQNESFLFHQMHSPIFLFGIYKIQSRKRHFGT